MNNDKVTIFDVAKRAGVSHMTVSRYFNKPESLSAAAYERVKNALKELHYVPNAAARNLAGGRTTLISLLVSDFTNPFFTTLARGVEDEARRQGYTFILGNTDETVEQERAYVDMLIAHQVEGIILSPTRGSELHLSLLQQRGIPVVLIDREVPGAACDLVRGDSRDGGRQLTGHLIERGYRDIAFIGGDPGISSLRDRLSGYREVMKEAGLEPKMFLGRYNQQSGEEIVERLLAAANLPRAILAANNLVAVGALAALHRHDIRVPEQVAIACVDDIPAASAIDPFLTVVAGLCVHDGKTISPFLTVVAQPAYEIGQLAMRTLLGRIAGNPSPPREHILPVKLLERKSSGG